MKARFALIFALASIAPVLAGCAVARLGPETEETASIVPIDQAQAQTMISEYRRAHGLNGLRLDPTLQSAAVAQAVAMAKANALSHTVAGTLEQRLAAVRFPPAAADENVSGGYASLSDAVSGWRKSPPHDKNLLDPKMRRMGIGSAYAPSSRYHQYWSLILAN